MAEPQPSPDRSDGVPARETPGSSGDAGQRVRETRSRIEADQLLERSLQRAIITKMRSAGARQDTLSG